jgi:opacity protein-like surface antigen
VNRSHIRMLVLMGGVILSSGSAAAQATTTPRANTEKLMLSFALGGTSISSDEFEDERETGGGFSAQLGWGFNRRFMLLVDASGAVMNGNDDEEEQFVLVHGDLLGRFHFVSPTRAWVPFIEGGISARVAGKDDIQLAGDPPQTVDLEISGGGITFGGGLRYHVSPAVALGASLRFTVGEFSTIKINNVSVEDTFELDATSTRLMFGVTWQPMLRKN